MKLTETDCVYMLKAGSFRHDKKGRITCYVPTNVRRNSTLIIPNGFIKKLLTKGLIDQEDLKKIRPY